jgi:putative addiction module component (TIGR02574 family)
LWLICAICIAALTVKRDNCVRGNLYPMSQISVADILELPVQERIHLVEVIWESIAAVPQAIEVSPELKTELEARLADFERNPEAGYSWDQVKAHLKNGSWRTA